MYFASDNQSGVSTQVLQMMQQANEHFASGYATDEWTQRAVAQLQAVFECDAQIYFVTTGTVANCLALGCMVRPWEVILAHQSAHIYTAELTAPEMFTGGARIVPVRAENDDKVTAESLQHYFQSEGDSIHGAKASAVSITQATETGLIYSPTEIQAISKVCRQHKVKLHMDGARFANALVAQDCTPAELTWQAGVDVLCLGATKLGCMCAEAVIFFDKALATEFKFQRKRAGQLLSKGRFLGAQFVGWLQDDHWRRLAKHANAQATKLAQALSQMEEVKLVYPVQSNQVFITLPKKWAYKLRENGAVFFEWKDIALPKHFKIAEDDMFIRLVVSFNTTDEHVDDFIKYIKNIK